MKKMDYLKLANEKYYGGNDVNYELSFNDFICDCYVRLKPCSYGSRIQTKILNEIGCESISPSLNIGDFSVGSKTIEIKVSFLSQSNAYNITHLRMWQKFNYYLFCFIDCSNGFTPEFYLIDKYVLNKIKMTPMNGTKESNSENTNIELRATIKKDGDFHKLFKKENKLNGTSLYSLKTFINQSLIFNNKSESNIGIHNGIWSNRGLVNIY